MILTLQSKINGTIKFSEFKSMGIDAETNKFRQVTLFDTPNVEVYNTKGPLLPQFIQLRPLLPLGVWL